MHLLRLQLDLQVAAAWSMAWAQVSNARLEGPGVAPCRHATGSLGLCPCEICPPKHSHHIPLPQPPLLLQPLLLAEVVSVQAAVGRQAADAAAACCGCRAVVQAWRVGAAGVIEVLGTPGAVNGCGAVRQGRLRLCRCRRCMRCRVGSSRSVVLPRRRPAAARRRRAAAGAAGAARC